MNVSSISNVNMSGAGMLGMRFGTRQAVGDQNASASTQKMEGSTEVSNSPADRIALRFFSAQGDSVEISKNAMELWRSNIGENHSAAEKAATPKMGTSIAELPNPITIWTEPVISSNDGTAQYNRTPSDFSGVSFSIPGATNENVSLPDNSVGAPSFSPVESRGQCSTCESRRYVDKSDDASVSYQTPTKLNASTAVSAVASHENEHVVNERGKAQREGREIVSQTVTITYDCCPECGKLYVSGGTTRTASVSKPDSKETQPDSDDNKVLA